MTKDWTDYLHGCTYRRQHKRDRSMELDFYGNISDYPQSNNEYRDEYDGCPEYAAYCAEWA